MGEKVKVEKMKQLRSVEVACPMFHRSTATAIYCEGLYPASSIVQHFGNMKEMKLQSYFCKEKYQNCELYRAIVEARFAEDED